MKNLAIAVLVFSAFICAAYSFKCYSCDKEKDEDYSVDQCEKDQKEVDCEAGGNYTCVKIHGTTTTDKSKEYRTCTKKSECEMFKKMCDDGPTEDQKKAFKIKDCKAACCVPDGDKPCNGGFTVSINMFMIMLAVLCSFKLF